MATVLIFEVRATVTSLYIGLKFFVATSSKKVKIFIYLFIYLLTYCKLTKQRHTQSVLNSRFQCDETLDLDM
jgi:hypothetical protein